MNGPLCERSIRRTVSECAAVCVLLGIGTRAPAPTVSFQEGVGGYTGTVDAYLNQNAPGTAHGTLDRAEWDSDDPPGTGLDTIALIRFDNVFGGGAGQVPIGSQITSATLTLNVINSGNAGNLYESAVAWNESATWDSFGGSPGVQPADFGSYVASPGGALGNQVIPVTASLAAWAANPAANLGWLILPAGSDGVEFRSRENTSTTLRPKLTVTYTTTPATPTLVRRPYLQRGTPTEMTVVWRTDIACDSRVRYGPAPGSLNQSASGAALVTDHVVAISGLSPATRYYYDVGTTATPLAGNDANHYFATSPLVGTCLPLTAWVVGDSGTGDAVQAGVRDAMLVATGSTAPDFYLHVGDMAYDSGTDAEFTSGFFAPYQDILLHTVCWPVIGNHEGTSSSSGTQSGPYYNAYVLPTAGEAGGQASGTEAYYSFDYANVHFIALDSHDSDRSPGSPMLDWLAADLAATDQDWIIALWHHPPYSKGTHDSDSLADSGGRMVEMRENVLPILEAGGVDLVLTGHSHVYERSYLVDGAYDTPTTAAGHIVDAGDGRIDGNGAYLKSAGLVGRQGEVQVVAGHGGQPCGAIGTHPLMFMTEVENGSCLLTVDGHALSMRNIRIDGVESDHFTILKVGFPGDLDFDADSDAVDLAMFIEVLLGTDSVPEHVGASDMNGDGRVDGEDIPGFVAGLNRC